jgi:hypothetical protein
LGPFGVVEVLVSIYEIFDSRAAGELQRFFDSVDAADVGIDKIRCALVSLTMVKFVAPLGPTIT